MGQKHKGLPFGVRRKMSEVESPGGHGGTQKSTRVVSPVLVTSGGDSTL